MKCVFGFLLLIICLNKLLSKNVTKVKSTSLLHTAKNKPAAVVPLSAELETSDYLIQVYTVAKNISHSKQHVDHAKQKHQWQEPRRSVIRKKRIYSETQNLTQILEELHSENQLKALKDLEFLVHQYDVAINFANVGGIKFVTPLLSSTNEEVVSHAAKLLGAAMQSNPVVQKIAMQENLGRKLIKLLSHKSPIIVPRVVYALSCLLRNHFQAQEEFLSKQGIYKLADVLKNKRITKNTKMKIVNLFNDLVIEQQDNSDQNLKDRRSAFKRLFAKEMSKYGICNFIAAFLNTEDYDTHQRVIEAMLSLVDICHKEFSNEIIKKRLQNLLKLYGASSKDKSKYSNLLNDKVSGNTELQPLKNVLISSEFLEMVLYDLDDDLKRALQSDLHVLISKIDKDNLKDSAKHLVKTEL